MATMEEWREYWRASMSSKNAPLPSQLDPFPQYAEFNGTFPAPRNDITDNPSLDKLPEPPACRIWDQDE